MRLCFKPLAQRTYILQRRRSKLVFGRRSRVFVVPSAGKRAPAKVTEVRRLMGFHLKYTARTRTHSHPTVSCLDKLTEVTMDDPNSRSPRKFTSMQNEYMDLRTLDNHEVFHAVFPWSTILVLNPRSSFVVDVKDIYQL